MPQMLNKHLEGLKKAFPGLEDAEYIAVFNAGYYTPRLVKAAPEEALASIPGIGAERAKKLKKIKPEVIPELEPEPEPELPVG